MEYRLVFTIYGLVFMVLLLVTLFFKKRKKSLRTSMYSSLIVISILLALCECLSIFVLKKYPNNLNFIRITWNIRNSFIFIYIYMFIYYFNVMIKSDKYDNFITLIFKNIVNLIIFVLFIIFIALYIYLWKFPGFTNEYMDFTGGIVVLVGLIIGFILCIVAFFLTYKIRKINKNYFNGFVLILILLLVVLPIQLFIKHVSFLPFLTMFIAYIIYYTIENPDLDLLNDLSTLKTNIDNSSNTKTDFLFNLSYDLVSPLNSLVSLSQVLYDIEVDNDTLINDIYSVKYLGNSLLESIDNILNMSDEKDINNKKYSLVELVNKINSFVVSKIGSKNISFQVSVNENINSNLIGDFNKINKILMNILSNSVKYTDVGKIIFDVNFSVSKDNNIILNFKISDTGCGIKDEEKSFVFSDDSSFKSGYGLAISKKYIEAMNGNIRFESSYGAGTTFYIDIPQGIYDNILYRDVVSNDAGDGDVLDFSNRKIMIVDDDELDIKVTKRYLKKYGVDVIGITNSIECVNRLKGYEEFDMLLVDHMMPVMNGVEILNVVKSLEGYKIPVMICLTANVIDGAREYYKNLGFDDYLAKPIDKKDFDKIIKRYLK